MPDSGLPDENLQLLQQVFGCRVWQTRLPWQTVCQPQQHRCATRYAANPRRIWALSTRCGASQKVSSPSSFLGLLSAVRTRLRAAAFNIREIHNLDSNAQSLRFELPDHSPLSLLSGCRAIDPSQVLDERFRRRWWPSPSELASLYTIYDCPPPSIRTTHLAIARTGSPVLYWTRLPDSP